jgi:hypothetical protein
MSNSYNQVGLIALESAHAVWEAVRLAKTLPRDQDVVLASLRYIFSAVQAFHILSLILSA